MTWTISSMLDWTTQYFENKGIENPHLEAEILLAHALGIKRIQLYVQHERALKEEELAEYKKLILRRVNHEPISYIIGYKPFMSIDLAVSKDVLIPRPETEKLVEVVLDMVNLDKDKKFKILDIGTGSGAIAVSIAKYAPNTDITAVDISKQAIEVARKNAETHKVSERIAFIEGNLFEPLSEGTQFDIIVSNPPYIPSKEIATLQPEIANFEPVTALDGGPDGLDYYRDISNNADQYIVKDGYMIFEVGASQSKDVVEIICKNPAFDKPKVFEDLNGIERAIVAKKV